MAALLTVEDLLPFAPDIDEAKAQQMIADATALAAQVAPCILTTGFAHADAAKAIIRGAILRWNDQGSGQLSTLTADVYAARFDTRVPRQAGGFYRSELKNLARLCRAGRGAYSIDLAPAAGTPTTGTAWPAWWTAETTGTP